MWVKFKEKTYETYFQTEIGRLTNISFAPDQTDEGLLGFDGAFFIPFVGMAGLFPYVRAARWRRFIGMSASEIDDFGDALNDRLPPFNLNLFVQYKRPQRMKRSNAAEWSCWGNTYYRYFADERQQHLLEKIAAAAHGRAAVVYASPAFWTNAELFGHARAGTIVANSNIADIALMTGHHRFSYREAGHLGIGHSDPEPIESQPFEAIIRRGVELEPMPLTRQMKALDATIREALAGDRGSERLWQLARQAILGGDVAEAFPRARGSWLDAIYSIIAFGQAFDVRVTALGVDTVRKASPER